MEKNQLLNNRNNKSYEHAASSRTGANQTIELLPKRSQIASVRLCSKNIDLLTFKALFDLYDDEND